MTDSPDPVAIAAAVTDVLDALGVPHTIGGSLAGSFAGEPRSTVDIDIVAAIGEEHIVGLMAALASRFYVDEDAVRRAVRNRASVNLIDQTTQFKVALFVAGGTALDLQQIERRQAVEVGGRTLHIHPPEDILLQKLRWFKIGGEVSDRQWRDIRAIVRVQATALDRVYLRANAPVLDVADLLDRALNE